MKMYRNVFIIEALLGLFSLTPNLLYKIKNTENKYLKNCYIPIATSTPFVATAP